MNVQKTLSQKADYCPPPPDGDFYRITDILDESERTVLKRVRDFMDREVAPLPISTFAIKRRTALTRP